MNTAADRIILKLFNSRILIFLGTLLFPAIIMCFLDFGSIDPVIIYLMLATGFITSIFILRKSLSYTILPFILLQMIFVWIFFDKKLQSLTGISLKIYGIVFGMSLIIAIYYIFKHFSYLWTNFIIFRCLFLFFLVNIFYILFYHSDFRTWFPAYQDMLYYSGNSANKLLSLTAGFDFIARDFNDPQIAIWLISLGPLVSVTVSLMTFYSLRTVEEFKKNLAKVINLIVYISIIHYGLAFLFLFTGVSKISFLIEGRLFGDFLGIMGGFSIYLTLFLIFFIGFKLYINTQTDYPKKNLINIFLDFLIIFNAVFILLQINKTSILTLMFSLIIFAFLCFKAGIKLTLISNIQKENNNYEKIAQLSPVILLAVFMIINFNFISNAFFSIISRFSSISTFQIRQTVWKYFIADWIDNLDFFKILLGFGIDASRELSHKIGFMLPLAERLSFQHAHNLYLTMFYDYGFMAFLYFGGIIYITIKNIKNILDNKADYVFKLFNIISLTVIIAFLIFYCTDFLKIPNTIVFFAMLGFLESVKYAYLRCNDQIV